MNKFECVINVKKNKKTMPRKHKIRTQKKGSVEFTNKGTKQIFTIRRCVKAIQQSNDLIGLGSNCRLKKLTDSNAHNTIKRKYFESAILKYEIYSDFSLSLFVFWVSEYNYVCNEKFFTRKITVISTRKLYYINCIKRSK